MLREFGWLDNMLPSKTMITRCFGALTPTKVSQVNLLFPSGRPGKRDKVKVEEDALILLVGFKPEKA